MKLLLYCTKAKPYLIEIIDKCLNKKDYLLKRNKEWCCLNGKIVAECEFEVSKIEVHQCFYNYGPAYFTKREKPYKYFSYNDLLEASCIEDNEILKYLGNKGGYAIHIKNLHIFDKPKELSDYNVAKAPQNMMRIIRHCLGEISFGQSGKGIGAIFMPIEEYILISIQPYWIHKILRGEKTIEIRKKVLKEMIKK